MLEGHLLGDHVHMLISIPPKYAVAQVIGFLKGKSAIHVARTFGGRKQNFTGQHFWARGYYVSTAGKDDEEVRRYIQEQEDDGLASVLWVPILLKEKESTMPPSHVPYPAELQQQMVDLVHPGCCSGELARGAKPSARANLNLVKRADRDAGRRTDGMITSEDDASCAG